MTDNFERYKEFIRATGQDLPDNNNKGTLDKYYVIELMRRGKDNPDLPAANYHFKNYYIYSWKDYETYKEEIKTICKLFRLRAYASVNFKLMSQVALDTIAESTRRIAAHDFKKFYNIFESCSGKFHTRANNLWIIDLDDEDIEKNPNIEEDIKNIIKTCMSKFDEPIVFKMPTKSGLHLITHPFNKYEFNKKYEAKFNESAPVIKDNHLTLLFEDL